MVDDKKTERIHLYHALDATLARGVIERHGDKGVFDLVVLAKGGYFRAAGKDEIFLRMLDEDKVEITCRYVANIKEFLAITYRRPDTDTDKKEAA